MINLSVMIKIADRAVYTEIEKIISTMDGFTFTTDDSPHCDLMICEITNENAEEQFNYIEKTMRSGKASNLFLVSGATDPNVLIQALKIGPKGFFQLPLNNDDVRTALLKLHG